LAVGAVCSGADWCRAARFKWPEAEKSRAAPKTSRLLFAFAGSYLLSFVMLSFDMSLFMLSSDFDFVDFLAVFFFDLALSVFMGSWPAGAVVWAEATDMLPTRAAQHATISRFRI
jgi:hypothetical protein